MAVPFGVASSLWLDQSAHSADATSELQHYPKLMGKIRRAGYILEWFIGDHQPRHIHVYDSRRRLLGRLDLKRMTGVEGWTPDRKLIKLVQELLSEGRL